MRTLSLLLKAQYNLFVLSIIPAFFGFIVCRLGPDHSTWIKAAIGYTIGIAIEHDYVAKTLSEIFYLSRRLFSKK